MSGSKPLAVVLSSDAIGLGAVRSLQLGEVPTVVVMMDRWEPVRASRYGRKILVPQSGDRSAAILEALATIEGEPRPVLMPTSDYLTSFVVEHRAELASRFQCVIPPDQAIHTVQDKAKDTQFFQGKIPLPRTVQALPSSPADLIRELGLPLIVKPRTFEDKRNLEWRNAVIRTRTGAEAFYRECSASFGNMIAQELIPGPDDLLWESMCLFDDRHEMVRAFTFRKLSTMPAHYGATARGISMRSDALMELSSTIGTQLGYVGIADIDVKYDLRDGRYKYLELNPRLGLCHYFATQCGVNLTLDAYRMACGETLADNVAQVEGRTCLAVLEEIGARLQSGESFLAISRGLLQALSAWPTPVGLYFTPADMLPGPFTVARIGYRLASKARFGRLGNVFTKQYDHSPAASASG